MSALEEYVDRAGLTEDVYNILWKHRPRHIGSISQCACGWEPALMLNDTESDYSQLVWHQAAMVVEEL